MRTPLESRSDRQGQRSQQRRRAPCAALLWVLALPGCAPAPQAGPAKPADSDAPRPDSAADPAQSRALLGRLAPDFELRDHLGQRRRLSDFRGRPVVLEWFDRACPFVHKWYQSGQLPALQRKYTGAGVAWLTIHSNAPGSPGAFSAEQAPEVFRELGLASSALLLDPDGRVARRFAANSTLHCCVIDPSGRWVYSGAIDDRPTLDPADIPTAKNHVAVDLDALLTAKPVEPHRTSPYGTPLELAK